MNNGWFISRLSDKSHNFFEAQKNLKDFKWNEECENALPSGPALRPGDRLFADLLSAPHRQSVKVRLYSDKSKKVRKHCSVLFPRIAFIVLYWPLIAIASWQSFCTRYVP
ncbi:hypothetical protein Bca4012_044200 [Brassica carinata]